MPNFSFVLETWMIGFMFCKHRAKEREMYEWTALRTFPATEAFD